MPCSASATIEQIDEDSVELADDEIQIWSVRTPASGMLSVFSGATAPASLSTATGRQPPVTRAGWTDCKQSEAALPPPPNLPQTRAPRPRASPAHGRAGHSYTQSPSPPAGEGLGRGGTPRPRPSPPSPPAPPPPGGRGAIPHTLSQPPSCSPPHTKTAPHPKSAHPPVPRGPACPPTVRA